MPKRWLNYLMMSLLLFASVAIGCRAPYPTYNPYGFYGQPCVNPPGTGAYRPNDPYYGTPTNGVYPPNPYTPYPYPGYPPQQQPAPGSTSKRTWSPQASTQPVGPTVQNTMGTDHLTASTEGWKSMDSTGGSSSVRTAALDTQGTFPGSNPGVPVNNFARIDGFERD